MKIKTNTGYSSLDGRQVVDQDGKPLTIKGVLTSTLANSKSDIKAERSWELAKQIFDSTEDEFEISVEELAQIKAAIRGSNWTPLVVAQTFQSFEE